MEINKLKWLITVFVIKLGVRDFWKDAKSLVELILLYPCNDMVEERKKMIKTLIDRAAKKVHTSRRREDLYKAYGVMEGILNMKIKNYSGLLYLEPETVKELDLITEEEMEDFRTLQAILQFGYKRI